jgi:hypothetical protein
MHTGDSASLHSEGVPWKLGWGCTRALYPSLRRYGLKRDRLKWMKDS